MPMPLETDLELDFEADFELDLEPACCTSSY
jgi:hypothetical protein